MSVSSVVFDLDGTLVDASADITHALNLAFQPLNTRPLTAEEVRGFLGGGPRALVDQSLRAVGCNLDEPEREKVLMDYGVAYRANPIDKTRLLADAEEALSTLHYMGMKLGICTNKRTDLANRVVDGLGVGHLFEVVLGGDSVRRPKPHPDHLLHTLAEMGTTAAQALYVGDTDIDAQAAQAAGVAYAQVAWADTTETRHIQLESFGELVDLIKNQQTRGADVSHRANQ